MNRFSVLSNNDFKPVKNSRNSRKKAQKKMDRNYEIQREILSKHSYRYYEDNGRVYNDSTLYVDTGVAYEEQIEDIINSIIKRVRKLDCFPNDYTCDFKVNVVTTGRGEICGYSYVDVVDPRLYWILVGRNPDGSERKKVEQVTKLTFSWGEETSNWADCEDCEEEVTVLPPLIDASGFELTFDEDQIEAIERTEMSNYKHLICDDGRHGIIKFGRAYVFLQDDIEDCPPLSLNGLPDLRIDPIKELFCRYARFHPEDTYRRRPAPMVKTNVRVIEKGRNRYENFSAIIKFDHVYDSMFALLMLRKIKYIKDGKEREMRLRMMN